MEIKYTKIFLKEIGKIKDPKLANAIKAAIENVKSSTSLYDINDLKKLKGYSKSYRIKIKDYRLGIFIDGNIVEFARFMPRKDIYRYFP